MQYLKLAVAAGGISLALTGFASALTLASGSTTCSVSDFTIDGANSSACEGAYDGNDSNQNLDGVFGTNGWMEIVKVDDPASDGTQNGVTLNVGNNGGTSGTWSVSDWNGYSLVMAVIKGGPTFSAYLLGDPSGTSGTWDTNGILNGNGGRGPGLSHLTLYYAQNGDNPPHPPAPIPLPAAGWLLLAGIGGMAALKRRRKSDD